MANLCIIPARGGSKRIPRKNIRDFLGKPIIAYSIETALSTGLFDEVMVSTDDEEIANLAKTYGAKVPFLRSNENSGDFATTAEVLLEVIERYEAENKIFMNACCIYPTAPLISIEKLTLGHRELSSHHRDVVFPVVAFSYPIWRGLYKNSDNQIQMVWPEHLNSRSQDLAEVYHDAGQWYWFNIEVLKSKKTLFTDNTAAITLDPVEVQDIDNESDWMIAELKHERLQSLK